MDRRELEEHQLRKQLSAHLANIPSLETLLKKEKRALVKEAERAGFTTKTFTFLGRTEPVSAEATQAWGTDPAPPLAWEAAWILHPWAKQLHDLLDRKMIQLPPPYMREYREYSLVSRLADDDQILSHAISNNRYPPIARYRLLEAFILSIEEYFFPYRRCPECKALFVAPLLILKRRPKKLSRFLGGLNLKGRPKQYCSSRCTNRATEAARKGTRREYMRQYMANKRKRALTRAKAEERAKKQAVTPVVTIRGTSQKNREQS